MSSPTLHLYLSLPPHSSSHYPLPSHLPPPPSASPPPQVDALIENAGSASTDVLAELKKTIQLKEALLIDAIVSSPRIVNYN